jgi:hypothetical protein
MTNRREEWKEDGVQKTEERNGRNVEYRERSVRKVEHRREEWKEDGVKREEWKDKKTE